MFRILFIGDVFGKPGRDALIPWLPGFRASRGVDFTIVNAENSAGGKGVSESIARDLFGAGADVLTGGNHSFAQRDSLALFDRDPRVLRPANLPPGTPGRGMAILRPVNGPAVAVINLMGRAFMKPIDCPFRLGRKLAEEAAAEAPVVIVDFHAEATSEKVAMAAHLDGLATAVIGTHTHIPSADARVSPRGTAAITDAGMTGPYDSVIGVKTEIVLDQLIVGMPVRHETASGDVRVCGVLIEADARTGRALRIERICDPEFVSARDADGRAV